MEDIFKKFIDNTISKEEFETLMGLIDDPRFRDRFQDIMDEHWQDIESRANRFNELSEVESAALYDLISSRRKEDGENGAKQSHPPRKGKIERYHAYRVAAIFVAAISLLFVYKMVIDKDVAPLPESTISDDVITLTLENGSKEIIAENGERKLIDTSGKVIGVQKGGQLEYSNTENMNTLIYNELYVPYGKRFDLVLSDNTHIKLNAGSSIRYPIQFIKGKSRKVFLKGEAYFDVSEDTEHPFIVNANEINVEVLGTEFNISFYPEDSNINTVLVEGSVKLYRELGEENSRTMSPTLLTPGYKAAWDKNTNEMFLEKVDTEIYTAWKDGRLFFKNSSFNSIRKKLERHFNITIENRFGFLEGQVYTATFRDEGIQDILEAFNEDTPFNYDFVDGNTVVISDKNN